MIACVILGLVLNLIGTGCAGVALVRDIREHDPQPFLGRTRRWVKRVLFRRPEIRVTAGTRSGTLSVLGSAFGRVGLSPSATDEQKLAYLMQEVDNLHNALASHMLQSQARLSEVRDLVDNLGIQFDVRATKIEATVKAVAVGSARLELWGLVLIGLGTFIGAVPTLAGWS